MTRQRLWLVALALTTLFVAYGWRGMASRPLTTARQGNPQATISALQTEVAELRVDVAATIEAIEFDPFGLNGEDYFPGGTFADSWDVVVTGMVEPETFTVGDVRIEPRGRFVALTLTVTNAAKKSAEAFPQWGLVLVDGEGRSFTYHEDATSAFESQVEQDGDSSDGELQPSFEYVSAVVFDVPLDASGFILSAEDGSDFRAPLESVGAPTTDYLFAQRWRVELVRVRRFPSYDDRTFGLVVANGEFVAVRIDATNLTDQPIEYILEGEDLILEDGRGRVFEPNSDAESWYRIVATDIYDQQPHPLDGERVEPGMTVPEGFVFDVPPDATDLTLRSTDGSISIPLDDPTPTPRP